MFSWFKLMGVLYKDYCFLESVEISLRYLIYY